MAEGAQLPGLVVPRDKIDGEISDRIAAGEDLKAREVQTPESLEDLTGDYHSWNEYNRSLLLRSFTTSDVVSEYQGPLRSDFGLPSSPTEKYRELVGDITEDIRRLQSIKARLPLFAEIQDDGSQLRRGPGDDAQDIFIVHGHNETVKQSVARFIQQITGREPIILHEQANSGRTVIEKFEQHAESVGFAVILLTGDDVGGKRGVAEMSPRARQNVIVEFGFFVGTLGRNRVAALHEAGVEVPSDFSGVLYTSLESDWRMELGREMRAAGIQADLNKAH